MEARPGEVMDGLDLQVLRDRGYERKICRVSGLPFWSPDAERTTSGDTVEDEYTFIGQPIIQGWSERGLALKNRMREAFLSAFEANGHTRVDPYPVLARWRDDIHLTIASIADFQPHVTSGLAEPPANPLTISQPCIRLTDVDAVGRSGRHLTTFEMMAHHVFNRPDDDVEHYWIERCVELCHELLTVTFGIDANEVTYVENPWSGGGNAGAAVEVIVGGLELATLVFMDLEEHPDGDVEIKGVRYRTMPLQIIDTGYGLERFCWAAAGTPTIYEAIYPESVAWLKDLSSFQKVLARHDGVDVDRLLGELSRLNGIMNIEAGVDADALRTVLLSRLAERGVSVTAELLRDVTEPLSRIYAIPDHLHALAHMLGDGLVPSNAKDGYLARMLARRVLRMRDDLGLKVTLPDLMAHHIDHHLADRRMKQTREGLLHILALEEARYGEMMRKSERIVRKAIADLSEEADSVSDDVLFELADVHGLQPEITIGVAREAGWANLELRAGFAAEMAERHARIAKEAARSDPNAGLFSALPDLPETMPLYYDDVHQVDMEASVLACLPLSNGAVEGVTHAVILDKTCFYPEGGGQEGDHGRLTTEAIERRVLDTRKQGGLVLHLTDGALEVGDLVTGSLDAVRRKQLMDHHTAVHIVGGAARRILGPHVFQAGANKSVESARLDITHHTRLSRDDLDAIEHLANEVLAQVHRTEKTELDRKEADRKWGFDLYQGGAPKGATVRILRIADHDVQACGGTHHDEPGRIGSIRIVRSTAVQDGVERLTIVAGQAALAFARQQDALLRQASEALSVTPEDLPRAAERFFTEWKEQQKRIKQQDLEIARLRTSGGGGTTEVDGVRMIVQEVESDIKQMTTMVGAMTRDPKTPTVAVLGSKDAGGKLLVAVTESSVAAERYNAVDILRAIAPHIRGGGGGRPTLAQGGGSHPEGLEDALNEARTFLGLS
ncbi:MAG: alanine--tRNA ligase [archaeon]|nr:alanine--tRNA ligase [archaeon]